MVDRTQLQRLAQEVEVLRKRLEEINIRIEQVDAVLAEHTITEAVSGHPSSTRFQLEDFDAPSDWFRRQSPISASW